MEISLILEAVKSQIRIVLTSPIDISQSSRIEPGKLVSFGISPNTSGATGFIDESAMLDLQGNLSSLTGTVPISQVVPLCVEVSWEITDENGNTAVEGIDYIAPNGLSANNVSLIFLPPYITELSSDPNLMTSFKPKLYLVKARVTVRAGGNNLDTQLSHPVSVLPLEIPSIIAAFAHKHFASFIRGRAIVLVPPNSVIRSTKRLFETLINIKNQVAACSVVTDYFLLKQTLDLLIDALISSPEPQIWVGKEFNLNEIPYGDADFPWANQIDSFMFLSLPGRTASFSNGVRSNAQGAFRITLDVNHQNSYVLCRSLQYKKPATEPFNTELSILHDPVDDTFSNRIEKITFEESKP
ncbi:hypothetical protein IAQ67_12650 [Paenibacillus peoriae]|uniref:Uncharacterized protein n=1 Tax=Paenibacillus peoriae TaxID=59893 RepID=A0A7H0YFB8_9BACL|nr:hypothetical protein [Paenibacillus peoriae]QNR69776.1 hypothetical protein IAQ67_12650 [Paenibacillus peoriae]